MTHALYSSKDGKLVQYVDPDAGSDQAMIVELRGSDGLSVMLPGSTHPDTNQPIEWVNNADPKKVDFAKLEHAARLIAITTLIIRNWGEDGNRHYPAMYYASCLARSKIPADDVDAIWQAVMDKTPNGDDRHRRKKVTEARDRIAAGKPLANPRKLIEEGVMTEQAATRLSEWLGITVGHTTYKEVRDELLDTYFVTEVGNSVCVMRRKWDPVKRSENWYYQSFEDFRKFNSNRHVDMLTNGKIVSVPLHKAFLTLDVDRPRYESVVMIPGEPRSFHQYVNVWEGFVADTNDASGNWDLLKSHILENICHGDNDTYEHFLRRLAWKVQNPTSVPGVAVAIHGLKGTGKTKVAEWFAAMFGVHGATISNHHHLFGHFNSHLQNKCVIIVEEAFWAGSKKDESTFKHMVTGRTLQIEPKGLGVFEVPNHMMIFLIGNDPHIVPASLDERRYEVYEIGNERRNDHAFFAAIDDQMRDGGLNAMYRDLSTKDIDGFLPNKVRETRALFEQKIINFDPVDEWIFLAIKNRSIPGSAAYSGSTEEAIWEGEHKASNLYGAFTKWFGSARKYGSVPTNNAWSRRMTFWLKDAGLRRITREVRMFKLPQIDDCRHQMEQLLGEPYDWESDDLEETDQPSLPDIDPDVPF